MKINFTPIYILFSTVFSVNYSNAQCTHQVSHATGIETINGIQVVASSFGFTENFNSCDDSEPYLIGWNFDPLPHGDGGYTFQFSPPIDFLNLNFSFINAANGTEEIVRIYLNGEHYFIPDIQASVSCSDSLAIINTEGDLAGVSPEHHYGGNVLITGPIHEITVLDSFIVGQPLGVAFSLFICSEYRPTSIISNVFPDLNIYPNPSNKTITVEGINRVNTKLRLFDLLGRPIHIAPLIQENRAKFDIDHLPNGIYYLSISIDEKVTTQKVIVSR